ncbi:MAG: SLC13 family permease [Candidatus Bipolaricaulia bacterium]
MDSRLILTFAILGGGIGLLLSGRIRADLAALLIAVALGVSGVLTPQEALSGFSRTAVITIMAIFVLAEGLRRTGLTERAGNLLLRLTGAAERRLVVIVMLAGAFLSLFMNNIAAMAVLLPAVSGAARKGGVNPSRILIPLAFSTLLGGMATLLTTTNIVVSSLLRDQGLAGFGLLDFAPVGLPLVAAGIAFMALWGRQLLPARSPAERLQAIREAGGEGDLVETYRLGERLFRARIPAGSYLIGKPLAQSTFREIYNLNVVAIEREGRTMLCPTPDAVLQEGDTVLLEGRLEEFKRRDVEPYLEILPPREWHERDLEAPAVVMVEAVLAPRSGLIGQSLRQAHFREKYGMSVLGIWRGDRPIRTGLSDLPLQFGDALLLQGPRERLAVLRAEPELILSGNELEEAVPLPGGKGWLALAIMALTLLGAAISRPAVGEIMLGGALAMILAGVLTMDQAYRAIDWKVVFLVAGVLPLGLATVKTGAATKLASGLLSLLGGAGPLALLAGLGLLTFLLSQAINGAAVAAIVAPVAIQAAQQSGADPRAFAMGVALATSMAFLTPLGHPVNMLIMGLGGYRVRDYVKVGLPLALLLLGVMLLLLPLFWPLE